MSSNDTLAEREREMLVDYFFQVENSTDDTSEGSLIYRPFPDASLGKNS